MCSGKFTCNYKGVLRNPSNKFLAELEKYNNSYTNGSVYDMIKEIERGERSMVVENLLDYYLRHPKKYLKVVNVNKGE